MRNDIIGLRSVLQQVAFLRRRLILTFAITCLFSCLSVQAQQADPNNRDSVVLINRTDDADRKIFVNTVTGNLYTSHHYEEIFVLKEFNQRYLRHLRNPKEPDDLFSINVGKYINELRAQYKDAQQVAEGGMPSTFRTAEDTASFFISFAQRADPSGTLQFLGPELMRWGSNVIDDTLGSYLQISAQSKLGEEYLDFNHYSKKTLEDSRDLSHDSLYSTLFTIYFAPSLGADVKDTAETLLNNNGSLATRNDGRGYQGLLQ